MTLRSPLIIDGANPSRFHDRLTWTRLREGGVTAINATVAIWEDFEAGVRSLQGARRALHEFDELVRPVLAIEDLHAVRANERTGAILGWQNTTPLGDDLDRMELFYDLGIRIVQLTYNERNLVGEGCYEESDSGLSRFGRDLVRVLNQLGVLIDLSHCGDRTTLEAIECSARPVAITHANPRSVLDHPRNKTDRAIRALVERGGVIGANAFPQFFQRGYDATIEDYVECIEHLVEIAGIDHVGIGTDFCDRQPIEWFAWIFSTSHGHRRPTELPDMPQPHRGLKGFEDPRDFSRLVASLEHRGFRAGDVDKILGRNWLRLFADVW